MARSSSDDRVASLATVFDALSDPTRLRVVLLLARSAHSVNSLCDDLGLGQPAASHHLRILRSTRLIVGTRKGKQVIYSLEPTIKVTEGKLKIAADSCSVTLEGY